MQISLRKILHQEKFKVNRRQAKQTLEYSKLKEMVLKVGYEDEIVRRSLPFLRKVISCVLVFWKDESSLSLVQGLSEVGIIDEVTEFNKYLTFIGLDVPSDPSSFVENVTMITIGEEPAFETFILETLVTIQGFQLKPQDFLEWVIVTDS